MKLNKLLVKALSVGTLALTSTSIGLFTTSCSNIDSLFFTVKNDTGLEIEFCDTGAAISSMKLNGTYLTYHQKDRTVFADKAGESYYHGKALGRVAGRIGDGKFKIDDKEYQVQVNETSATKNNCLHGGYDSFSFKDFKRYVREDKANKRTYVAFNYVSQDGEAGFPETIHAWVIYTLHQDENILDTTLYALPTGKTIINMSTHSLFRLANDGDVLNYELTVPANYRAKFDNEDTKKTGQVVIGKKSVTEDNNYYNFKTAKKIGQDIEKVKEADPISNGYDHIWVEDDIPLADRYVKLYNPTNKIEFKLVPKTEKVNAFILYTNDYPRAGHIMCDGKEDTQHAAITIEPYTFFTKDDISPMIYTPDNPFYNKYSYEIKQYD